MEVHGFTLLRNGVKYDYPFEASLKSLLGLCSTVVLALGDSEDSTEEKISALSGLTVIHTHWGAPKPDGGHVLSEQTNLALEHLRTLHPKGWALYLQADEVISEQDHHLIKRDLEKADQQGCDAVRFRYYHFWKHYHQLAISRRWYPHEIRAIRLDSTIKSFGDAQSFQNAKKVYESEARIFHYGHVKPQDKLDEKNWDFGLWWHTQEDLKKALRRGKQKEQREVVLPYFGHHPMVMHDRIKAAQTVAHSLTPRITHQSPTPPPPKHLYILTENPDLIEALQDQIHAKVHLISNLSELNKKSAQECLVLKKPKLLERLFYYPFFKTHVPFQMHSPNARPYTEKQYLALRLSEKNIKADF